MDVNEALSQLGSFGLYQFYVYFISILPQTISGLFYLSSVFISATPDYRCLVDQCEDNYKTFDRISSSLPYNKCNKLSLINQTQSITECIVRETTELCESFIYSREKFESTIVSEWDLVCDNSWKLPFSQSVYMIGILFGVMVNGYLADRFGRKTLFIFLPILTMSSSLTTAFAPNYETYVVSTAVTAFSVMGMSQTAYIIGIEFIGPKYRVLCANLTNILFAFGSLTLCIIAYYVRDWRRLQLIISLPYSITLLYYWLFPESVRWQVSNGYLNSALITIRRAAKWNGVLLNEELFIESDNRFSKVNKYGPLDLFRHPITRNWTLNLAFIWITNSIIYFGLSFQASSLGSDLYLTFGLLFVVDIPVILVASVTNQIYGRKKVLMICLFTASVSCVATIFISHSSLFFTFVAVFGKSSISAAFAVIYMYSAELYPTFLRSSGVGICSMISRIGGILSPFLYKLSVFGDNIPFIFCAIIALISGLLVFNLPETLGRELPEDFDDIYNLKYSKTRKINLKSGCDEKTRLLS